MEKNNSLLLVAAFMAMVIGVALLISISTQEQILTSTIRVSNESFDFGAAATESYSNINGSYNFTITDLAQPNEIGDEFISSACIITMYNASGGALYTEDTHYSVNCGLNIFSFLNHSQTVNDSKTGNDTMITYEFTDKNYIKESWQRSVLDLVPGFFALSLLLIGIGLLYAILKRENLLNI